MKKVGSFILALAVVATANIYGIDANGTATESFDLTHVVARKSSFSSISGTTEIAGAVDDTQIGTLYVENNTRDGYKVTVASDNGFNLKPKTTADGEANIPYTLNIKSTDIANIIGGSNMTFTTSFTAGSDGEVHDILNRSAGMDTVLKATPLSRLGLSVGIADSYDDQMDLAGDYDDTLTFTYTDL